MKFRALLPATACVLKVATACGCHQLRSVDDAQLLARRSIPGKTSEKTVLTNVRVFDGYEIGDAQKIYIDGERISHPFPPCIATKTIDAGGRVLIPGLMDAHIHVPDVAGLENLTAWGVTTAFNMACSNYTQCHALSNYPRTPKGAGLATLFSSGRAANSPLTPITVGTATGIMVSDGDNAAEFVDEAFRNGSDYYKIVSKQPGLSQQLQNDLVSEVHRLGQLSMTHASDLKSYMMAIASNTDGIQHIASDSLLSDSAVATVVAKKGQQWSTPTMEIFRQAFANPIIIEFLRGSTTSNDSWEVVVENVGMLHRAGVLITAGTDAVGDFQSPIANLTIPIGPTLHSELANLVEAGLSEAEALRAATSVTARVHRLNDRGTIEVGKRADLVLLDADPLVNISNTKKIAKVWVGGIEYPDVAGD